MKCVFILTFTKESCRRINIIISFVNWWNEEYERLIFIFWSIKSLNQTNTWQIKAHKWCSFTTFEGWSNKTRKFTFNSRIKAKLRISKSRFNYYIQTSNRELKTVVWYTTHITQAHNQFLKLKSHHNTITKYELTKNKINSDICFFSSKKV